MTALTAATARLAETTDSGSLVELRRRWSGPCSPNSPRDWTGC